MKNSLFKPLAIAIVFASSTFTCHLALANDQTHTSLKPILIQGAMPVESEYLAQKLENSHKTEIGGWTFWEGTINQYPVVVSKTKIGSANASAATAIAIMQYHPIAIINQGTAGGHDSTLHTYDIVLGTNTINIGAQKTPFKKLGEGSDSLAWSFMPLEVNNEGPAIVKYPADKTLLAIAQKAAPAYQKGKVVDGNIGSADMWDNELDRIKMFHEKYGTRAEEMEAAAVASTAQQFKIPFLTIRVLSNNITNNNPYDENTAKACQDFVYHVVSEYIATVKK